MQPETRIHLHTLSTHKRGAEYVVGYEPARAYITVDEQGMRVLKHLKTHTVGETAKAFPNYDVKLIAQQLIDNGLVHKINHRVVHKKILTQDILDIPPKYLKWVHHPLTRGSILGFVAVLFIVYLTQPQLVPSAEWFFATTWLSLLIPGALIAAWALHFLHELGHYAAIRATGYPTGFHLAHRWQFIVPEADLAHTKKLTPPQQTRVYLAGFAVDAVILGFATLMIAIGVGVAFWQLIALLIWFTLLVQLLPVAYTDAAKIAERITKRSDVLLQARRSVTTLCPFCKTKDEHQALRAHLFPWMLIGIFLGLVLLLVYVIPVFVTILERAVLGLVGQPPYLIDAVLALFMVAVSVSMYSIGAIREHHLGVKQWFTWLCVALYVTANFVIVFLLAITLLFIAQPLIIIIAFLLCGAIFGRLFITIVEHIRFEQTGFATDTLLPVYAASTALLLVLLLAGHPLTSGIETLIGIAYAIGMLGSLVV